MSICGGDWCIIILENFVTRISIKMYCLVFALVFISVNIEISVNNANFGSPSKVCHRMCLAVYHIWHLHLKTNWFVCFRAAVLTMTTAPIAIRQWDGEIWSNTYDLSISKRGHLSVAHVGENSHKNVTWNITCCHSTSLLHHARNKNFMLWKNQNQKNVWRHVVKCRWWCIKTCRTWLLCWGCDTDRCSSQTGV